MGVTLSIWDRLAGTYLCSQNQKVAAFGIGAETPEWRSLGVILFRPLGATWKAAQHVLNRRALRAQRPARFGRAPIA
jgi:sterol desaturase/sphingolipid hydroxylase (fatty acid hydroxylase superfamily)